MKQTIMGKPTKKIFLISCVGQKLEYGALAKDLYISEWFKKAWAYCQQRSDLGTETYILSAKHGLLGSEDFVDPYESSLINTAKVGRRKWADNVSRQLISIGKLKGLEVEILAGEKYREFLVPFLEASGAIVSVPMKGLGIGEQMSHLKNSIIKWDTAPPVLVTVTLLDGTNFTGYYNNVTAEYVKPNICKTHLLFVGYADGKKTEVNAREVTWH